MTKNRGREEAKIFSVKSEFSCFSNPNRYYAGLEILPAVIMKILSSWL
jgi:hypothetical protein